MKKAFLIIIGALFIISTNGQINKLSIGAISSSDYYNYRFNQDEVNNINYNLIINFSVGISMHYNLNKALTTKTGLLYSKKGFTGDFNWQLYPGEMPDPAFNKESKMILDYLEIPLLGSYKFVNQNKLSIFVSSGLVTSFLVNEEEFSTMQDGSEKETDFWELLYKTEFNPILFNFDFEVGLNYNINEIIFLSIEPYFRYGLNKLSDEILKSNPLSYGLRLGFHLRMDSILE